MTAIDIQIIIYGLLGLALVYLAKKRRFERTTIYSTQQFTSYKAKIKARLIDALQWGFGIGGLLSATLLIFMEHAPVWGFLMLFLAAAFAIERDYYTTPKRQYDRTH